MGATEKDHVVYESRLELARLPPADFDVSVRGIVAQPFLLKSTVSGQERKHVPNFLLFIDDVPLVVDVKPRHRVARPENAFTFDWTRQLAESKGWRNQVFSEPPRSELENVRFLAGYRRDWLFDLGLLEELHATDLDGIMLKEALKAAPAYPRLSVRSALLNLMWRQQFAFDLTIPLNSATVLRRSR